jgi:hypothetical protein
MTLFIADSSPFSLAPPPDVASNPTGSTPSGTGTGSSPNTTDKPKEEPLNVGAIAGGVVGGVIFIAIITAALFFLIRQRKKGYASPNPASELPGDYHQSEMSSTLGGYSPAYSPQSKYKTSPAPYVPNTPQTPQAPPTELPAHHGFSELISPHGRAEVPTKTHRFSWQEDGPDYSRPGHRILI